MKKKPMDLLMTMSLLGPGEYAGYFPNDERVVECLWDMYFYMMHNGLGNEDKKEEYFKEFKDKYIKLNDEQQKEVKKEYINIIEAQKKNRGKIKKKGMIDYE